MKGSDWKFPRERQLSLTFLPLTNYLGTKKQGTLLHIAYKVLYSCGQWKVLKKHSLEIGLVKVKGTDWKFPRERKLFLTFLPLANYLGTKKQGTLLHIAYKVLYSCGQWKVLKKHSLEIGLVRWPSFALWTRTTRPKRHWPRGIFSSMIKTKSSSFRSRQTENYIRRSVRSEGNSAASASKRHVNCTDLVWKRNLEA